GLQQLQSTAGATACVLVQTDADSYALQLRSDLRALPYAKGVPQQPEAVDALIDQLRQCRAEVVQSSESTRAQVDLWHDKARSFLRAQQEIDARKSLTYWFFCKEQFESLNQFQDVIDLLTARLTNLKSVLQNPSTQMLAVQKTIEPHHGLEAAQAAIEMAKG